MLDHLRPLSRRLRSRFKPRVFSVRKWTPSPPAETPEIHGPLAFDVLWRTAKHRAVTVDAAFRPLVPYPVPGSTPLPLIDVHTRTGEPYLSISFCPVTGAVFHRLLPDREWLHTYYASEWDQGKTAAPAAVADLLAARTEKVGRILRRHLSKGMRVLDVGSGYGDQLYYLKARGCVVQGIEPSRHRAEFASTQLGVPTLNCPIDGGEIREQLGPDARFDLIYLNQVLEHLNDPLGALTALRPLLADDGSLMIGVPDLFSESLGTFCGSITHTHSFSGNALRNMAALAGYAASDDLSFPGYLYLLFKPVTPKPNLADPLRKRVLRYVADHFGLSDEAPKTGEVISLSSSYTGRLDMGLRVATAPADAEWRRSFAALRRGSADDSAPIFQIHLTMAFEKPVLWLK